ncbi:hypothetical protein JW721_03600 [Candidatus Micrarchaeota archaeon]|nr:hypothetical protein [Candidatus Micrarchaeota archaeon]
MKERGLHKNPHARRAAPAKNRGFKKPLPLISSLATGALLAIIGSQMFCKPKEIPQNQPPGRPVPAMAENEAHNRIDYLKTLIAQRKKIMRSGSRSASAQDDFESYNESLAYMRVPELKRQWKYYNMLARAGASPLTPSGKIDWEEAGKKAREAEERKNAAGREIARRKEAGENVQTPKEENTNPDPEWLGELQTKSLEELGALLKEEIDAVTDAAKYYSDSVREGDEAAASDALTEFEEASRHMRAIKEEGNRKARSDLH